MSSDPLDPYRNVCAEDAPDPAPVRPRPVTTFARVVDMVDAVDVHTRDLIADVDEPEVDYPELVALRIACETLDKVLRAYPTVADRIEADAVTMCTVLGLPHD